MIFLPMYSYEVETIIKSQPFYLKQSIVGAVKCVEGLSDGLDWWFNLMLITQARLAMKNINQLD